MATSASIGDVISSPEGNDVTIPVTITSDGDGGALAAVSIFKSQASHMKLDELEIVDSEATGTLTLKSSRGSSPKTVFQKALPAGSAIYGGHQTLNIFPKMDNPWTIETSDFGNNLSTIVYLKFTRYNG